VLLHIFKGMNMAKKVRLRPVAAKQGPAAGTRLTLRASEGARGTVKLVVCISLTRDEFEELRGGLRIAKKEQKAIPAAAPAHVDPAADGQGAAPKEAPIVQKADVKVEEMPKA
jgi:hypothetical protein